MANKDKPADSVQNEDTIDLPERDSIKISDVDQTVPDDDSQELAPSDAVADQSSLSIDYIVVEKIVAITCRSIDGILQMKGNFISSLQEGFGGTDITKGVSVEMVGEKSCRVNVSIIMEYGKSAPRIFEELRDKIREKTTSQTGLQVEAVNVRVVNVMTREEMDVRRKRDRTAEQRATEATLAESDETVADA